jgi:photosystem II stability/assembly factor-like uncharacterized protein
VNRRCQLRLLAAAAIALAGCGPAASSPTPVAHGTVGLPTEAGAATALGGATAADLPTEREGPPTSSPAASVEGTAQPASRQSISGSLMSIKMIDEHVGWGTARLDEDGLVHVLRTADGGSTWADVTPGEAPRLDAFFLDGAFAWVWGVFGGAAWRTGDGGESWREIGAFHDQPFVAFNDSQNGWRMEAIPWGLSFQQFDIVTFLRTEDGGDSWQNAALPPGVGSPYLTSPSPQWFWTVQAGFRRALDGQPNLGLPVLVSSSKDGTSTWTSRQLPMPATAQVVDLQGLGPYLGEVGNCTFVSPVYSSVSVWKMALTCQDGSWLYTSANQGETWIIHPMPAGLDVQLAFVDPRDGWLFIGGYVLDFQGKLFRTTNGGQSWSLIKQTGWGDVRMSFIDSQHGWLLACQSDYCYQDESVKSLLMTRDAGQTWVDLDPQLHH